MTNAYGRITCPSLVPSTYFPPENPTLGTRVIRASIASLVSGSHVLGMDLHREQPTCRDSDLPDYARYELGMLTLGAP